MTIVRASLARRLAPVLLAASVLPLSACGINSVPAAEEVAKARWADVQAAYQRRADLVPNLVATVKGAANFEQGTLTKITEARAKATSVQLSADDLTDPAKVAAYQQAQSQLSQALRGFTSIAEAYPDLKSNQNFLTLQSQLEGTDNRVNITIRDYNEAVRDYNTRIRTFPEMIGAKLVHGAKPITPFQAAPDAQTAPKVDFGG